MSDDAALARTLIARLDLTELKDGCTGEDVARLLARAPTPAGNVAAVCVWPAFVGQSVDALAGTGILVATAVNFPAGGEDIAAAARETERAVADGADEIDMVVSWRRVADDPGFVTAQVSALKEAAAGRTLKAILESGELASDELVREAARAALAGGADFVKTSTGKAGSGATPGAARQMLEAIREAGGKAGFKASGGVRSLADAAAYLNLAEEINGAGWATASRFRIGASGVLDDLLAHAGAASGGGVTRSDY